MLQLMVDGRRSSVALRYSLSSADGRSSMLQSFAGTARRGAARDELFVFDKNASLDSHFVEDIDIDHTKQ